MSSSSNNTSLERFGKVKVCLKRIDVNQYRINSPNGANESNKTDKTNETNQTNQIAVVSQGGTAAAVANGSNASNALVNVAVQIGSLDEDNEAGSNVGGGAVALFDFPSGGGQKRAREDDEDQVDAKRRCKHSKILFISFYCCYLSKLHYFVL